MEETDTAGDRRSEPVALRRFCRAEGCLTINRSYLENVLWKHKITKGSPPSGPGESSHVTIPKFMASVHSAQSSDSCGGCPVLPRTGGNVPLQVRAALTARCEGSAANRYRMARHRRAVAPLSAAPVASVAPVAPSKGTTVPPVASVATGGTRCRVSENGAAAPTLKGAIRLRAKRREPFAVRRAPYRAGIRKDCRPR